MVLLWFPLDPWCRGAIYNPAVPMNHPPFHGARPNEVGQNNTTALDSKV
jgi:hypothetical protein